MSGKFSNHYNNDNQDNEVPEECEDDIYKKDAILILLKSLIFIMGILWSFSFIICTLESYSGYSINNKKQKEENVSPKHSFTGLFEAVGETIKDELTIDWDSLLTKSSE